MENQDNQQRRELPQDDSWLDQILDDPQLDQELLPD